MKAGYYSSLPNNEASNAGKVATPPSPRKAIESAATTISQAVNSARAMRDRARSYVPKKLLAVQCTPVKRVGGSTDLDALEEECTPVIYYTDEDAVAKRAAVKAFVDPFAFECSESSSSSPKEKDAVDSNSPTSVVPVRLFAEEESISTTRNDSKKKSIPSVPAKDSSKQKSVVFGDVVTFDCPVFTPDPKLIHNDDSSFEFSETIKRSMP